MSLALEALEVGHAQPRRRGTRIGSIVAGTLAQPRNSYRPNRMPTRGGVRSC